ncbi:MAG: pyridoxamine 5'-phosphate oxidase family protein [Actinobacteria bacterium]|nr:pyridoxamine 5'-phosphate oxidase family protein [Actinomycetota bacterium]
MPTEELTKTDAVTVKRKRERADYRRDSANAILDEGLVAHVGIAVDGQPLVIPMAYGRDGDRLILHGSRVSRLLKALGDGQPVCVTVTLVDDVVFARSQFHMSMNYRSVVVVGVPRLLADTEEKRAALEALVEHVAPGRTAEARPATDDELDQILAVEIPIDTASVKARTEGVIDEPEDHDLDIWAGLIPIKTVYGAPICEPDLRPGINVAPSALRYRRPTKSGKERE